MSNIQNPNSQFTALMSGSIQSINTSTIVNGNTVNTSTSSSATQTDCNIFPVGSTIDPSNYMYDGQTILMVNSTLNQNINTATAKYYDPATASTANWNFDMQSNNIVNGMYSYSSLLENEVDLYTNLLPTNTSPPTGKYSLDITNGSNSQALFFSLTSQPYTNTSPPGTPNSPTILNINPEYGNNNSDNFLFTSNYYIQQKSEILIIQLIFTISNTGSTNVNSSQTNYSYPTISVIIKNKIVTKDVIASMSSNSNFNNSKIKTYTAGAIPLQYLSNGSTFSPTTFSYYLNNNVPIVIAPGYTKVYATMPIIYVPPYASSGAYYGQSLIGSSSSAPQSSGGYYIDSTGTLRINESLNVGISQLSSTSNDNKTCFGHFVVGVSYSSDYQKYSPYTNIQAEVQIKNIWRSPISIYNSYSSFSVIDMATRQVVVLFGKSVNGGTFLVTNTGTPISSVDSYAVTSLRNFMSIMRGLINQFDGSASLVDYFINPATITQVNNLGNYNIQPLIPQPLMEGSITNPLFTNGCPAMYYLFLSSKNSANLTIDPSEQIVFSNNINNPYLGVSNSVLCSTGNCKYGNANLTTLGTDENQVFGNSLYVGFQLVNNITYSVLIILPEAMFNYPANVGNNTLNIYSTDTSIFYLSTSPSSSSQFTTSTTVISNRSTTTTPTFLVVPNQGVSKIIISVSNSNLVI
jgi:hypothetical protein